MDVARDISAGEKVEGELDIFISRRHDKRVAEQGERVQEELWRASERRDAEQRREENRAAWCEYHRAAAERARRTLEELIARHEAAAQTLEADTREGDAA